MALSGGGARGAAHVGVLMALEEAGLLPDRIAGTSAGGIVAGLYAAGMSIQEMKEQVQYLSRKGKWYLDPDAAGLFWMIPQLLSGNPVRLAGLLRGNRLRDYLCSLTEGKTLQDISVGLLIPAVDLVSGNTVIYTNRNMPDAETPEHGIWERQGGLCEIMMASASVPAVFSPRQLGPYRLVDGGVTNNLPVDLMITAGERCVVGVDIGSEYDPPRDSSIVETSFCSFSLMSRALKDCRSSGEKLLLTPRLDVGAGLLDFGSMPASMERGYEETRKQMPEIRRVIERNREAVGRGGWEM